MTLVEYGLIELIKSDIIANKRNWKGIIVLFLYRIANHHLRVNFILFPLSCAYLILYKIVTELVIGTEIHWRCRIGKGACVYHGFSLVINSAAVIGDGVRLRHGVTIGEKVINGRPLSPRIGNNVDIGVGAILLGDINIGDNAVIGAGAVVVKDVPKGAVVAGNPARVIRYDV